MYVDKIIGNDKIRNVMKHDHIILIKKNKILKTFFSIVKMAQLHI